MPPFHSLMMLWQTDLHRPPLIDPTGQPLWEILFCTPDFNFSYSAQTPQGQVNQDWIREHLHRAIDLAGAPPDRLQVFRPQALSLLSTSALPLGIGVEPTRHTPALHRWLQQRSQWYSSLPNATGLAYNPLHLDQPPPVPLAENLWGQQWGFTVLKAAELERTLPYEPIPMGQLPVDRLPSRVGLASPTPIPGVVIDAGPQAMALCRWLEGVQPAWLRYQSGDPDGLVLEAGLNDRWIITTFTDQAVSTGGQVFEQRKAESQGLHFLLVRPDASGMTYTGLWLLQQGQTQD
ncbi:MAG: Tab2 family RNA-binding protein [Nodosilinea sp.]